MSALADEYYTVPEAAARLRVCERTIRHLTETGQIEAERIGRRRIISDRALAEYLERQRRRTP